MGEVALVTGGCGFLGSFIVEVLLSEILKQRSDVAKIIVVDVKKKETVFDEPQLEKLRQTIVTYQTIDIRNPDEVDTICIGVHQVFHCASLVYVGTCVDEKLLYHINVIGTQNVISACLKNAVSRLMQAKQIAEKAVLEANGMSHKEGYDVLSTCSVRPVVMYGERDPHNLPNVFGAAKHLPLIRFGNRNSVMSFSYVGNVAYGAVLAGKQLKKNPSKVSGQVFTITDETPPNNFFEIHRSFLESKGYRVSNINIHWTIMYLVAFIVELITWILQPIIPIRVPFCRGIVQGMRYTHVFHSKHAEEILGYKPLYDYQTAFNRTMKYWKDK